MHLLRSIMTGVLNNLMKAEQLLFSQGFGTRSECRNLIFSEKLTFNNEVIESPETEISIENGQEFTVNGEVWPYYEKAILVMNKPIHYECSTKPQSHPSVNSLLPSPLRTRGLQPVGRLDEDTTGLLLFTDNGQLNHYLTHPKRKVQKVYKVGLKYPATPTFIEKLLKGVVLKDSPDVIRADRCDLVDSLTIHLAVSQGKYHQVKRMIAAASNRVVSLHRIQFGKLSLPLQLESGKWLWVTNASEIL